MRDLTWLLLKVSLISQRQDSLTVLHFGKPSLYTRINLTVTRPLRSSVGLSLTVRKRQFSYMVHLERVLFHNCDLSHIGLSDVHWAMRPRNISKNMLFDELVDPTRAFDKVEDLYQTLTSSYHPEANRKFSNALLPRENSGNPRNYRVLEELYQKLKRNYDDQADYRTAGDFHYGELEVMRLRSHRKNRVLRRLHTYLGLVAWYKYISEYGENYLRPGLLWLPVTLLLFTFLYPVGGLDHEGKTAWTATLPLGLAASYSPYQETLSYWHPLYEVGDNRTLLHAQLDLLIDSGITSIEVATFQKNVSYPPSYRSGRVLTLLEQLVTSTLTALFLLAIRRQFKR